MTLHLSPNACDELVDSGVSPFDYEADELQGQTDCPDGCCVEPDGHCSHGYLSAMETLLRVAA